MLKGSVDTVSRFSCESVLLQSDVVVIGRWCNWPQVVSDILLFYYYLHIYLSEIWNNCICKILSNNTSMASNIRNCPIIHPILSIDVKIVTHGSQPSCDCLLWVCICSVVCVVPRNSVLWQSEPSQVPGPAHRTHRPNLPCNKQCIGLLNSNLYIISVDISVSNFSHSRLKVDEGSAMAWESCVFTYVMMASLEKSLQFKWTDIRSEHRNRYWRGEDC